ncbi:hypothetical protein SODALDRAFT_361059 [Sodiomyces alkalinus F11]|uniref:Uncharacterized protein n=1 Tax=Sodiomyces alkalinus (strain CBS 110278 / VKM F-3762 / F11) TaxID=1314773 RepID=A0A3N2PS83_SODAK|nr:hypothetical protein SODALDRAFT_361059 [Sodiomyces alkalinus F11]ROT37355.1 hypothetical protein SODALDRAFT_361059 [Sodiomyces alkalinus F11]
MKPQMVGEHEEHQAGYRDDLDPSSPDGPLEDLHRPPSPILGALTAIGFLVTSFYQFTRYMLQLYPSTSQEQENRRETSLFRQDPDLSFYGLGMSGLPGVGWIGLGNLPHLRYAAITYHIIIVSVCKAHETKTPTGACLLNWRAAVFYFSVLDQPRAIRFPCCINIGEFYCHQVKIAHPEHTRSNSLTTRTVFVTKEASA